MVAGCVTVSVSVYKYDIMLVAGCVTVSVSVYKYDIMLQSELAWQAGPGQTVTVIRPVRERPSPCELLPSVTHQIF